MNSTTDPGLSAERCRRLENQVSSLKHVSSLRKSLLELRERQVKDLISKLKFYEVIVTEEREARHSLSNRLESAELQCGKLTERLTKNIQTIDEQKANYENKVSTLINELETSEQRNQQLSDQINCAQLRISEVTKDLTMEELTKKLEEASIMLEAKDRLVKDMQKQMKRVWERNKVLSYQMSLLNNLFTETEGVSIDFEKIKTIGDIVRESQSYTDDTEDVMSDEEFSERRRSVDLENLLDSIEKSENQEDIPGEESCYKSVDTKRGPQLVLSVSRTFIKLKDLILEKKSLQKDIDSLKSLNTKLESKVDKQEHRLYRVTMELNKTWSLVSKLKQQHKRLYNSEAVLRYELQEKRRLLDKLKNELSASREKWRRVRQKNSQSQVEWEKLRDEFAQRKHQSSQESGTFSEVMSVSSSGENDPTEEDGLKNRRRNSRGNKLEKSNTLPMSFTTSVTTSEDNTVIVVPPRPPNFEEGDDEPPEEDFEEGATALSPEPCISPVEDEHFEDPLEELVSQLVEDIDNEADTEEESSSADQPPLENDSSPSPDFEDRMKRRANRLRMLEDQCHILHQKLVASTARSVALSSKLAELHDHYGPSRSAETPSDEQQQGDLQPSQAQTDAASSENPPSTSTTSPETKDAPTTDIASDVTTPENNNNPDKDTVSENSENDAGSSTPKEDASVENEREESSASKRDELISASENSSVMVASPSSSSMTAVETEHNKNPDENLEKNKDKEIATGSQSQQPQGHSNDKVIAKVDRNQSLLTIAKDIQRNHSIPVEGDSINECTQTVTTSVIDVQPITNDVSFDANSLVSSRVSEALPQVDDNIGHVNSPINCDAEVGSTPPNSSENRVETEELQLQGSLISPEQISNSVEIQEVPQSQVSENILPVEEPLPIIQETVVQHFPTTTEEEANEFAPVQIRPEFLRILQEADEATNVSSLDWMPSLLTITHSVALLRLDHDSASTTRNNNSRSLSDALRIEIPRQSPSPPPAIRQPRQEGNAGRTNHNDGHVSAEEEMENERATASRKDPSFLSRMIIKQLPKRLQLLKNENHTLQMETAEAKMRMKEMKRQLTKELERQQQLANSLDTQIEDKNLIEFELREELEKKERVIDQLQVEIDESKNYVDELKNEKDEIEAFLKVFIDEKFDLSQPKTLPETVRNCNNCKRPFSLVTRRKVHCKICGKVFCKDCALFREPHKSRSSKRPRLCTRCHLRRLRLVVLVNASKQSASKSN